MPHRPCLIRHQSTHWSQKPRSLSIADFRLLRTHVVLYSLTSSSFVSGHDRLVHASAARGIICGLETAVVDKDTQKRRPAGLSKPAGRRLLFFLVSVIFLFQHLPYSCFKVILYFNFFFRHFSVFLFVHIEIIRLSSLTHEHE